jgi:hypothetical protein
VLKLLIGEDDEGAGAFGVSISRGFGLYLAVLAALGVAGAGFLKFTEAGGKLNEVQGQLKQMGSQASAAAKSASDSARSAGGSSSGSDVPPPPPPPPAP